VVAISADPAERSAQLAAKLGLTFPVLGDPQREVIRLFGIEDVENEIAWPALFVIGPDRKIVRRVMLETYKERPLMSQILEALDQATPKK
jgi:peroxiredoxin